MRILAREDVDAYVEARDHVVQAAEDVADRWERWPIPLSEMTKSARNLVMAVRALRSLDADRGLRDPGTPGEQEPGQEQAHGPDTHDREQS